MFDYKSKKSFLRGNIPFYLFFFLLVLFVSKNAFFWDTVQLSAKHASFYFNNGLVPFLLPDEMDSGHIPTFGYLLAVVWKLFGKSLIISHLFLLPFLWGIVYQANRLLSFFIEGNNKFYLTVFLAGPTLLAQATLISPDIPLVFFMLLLLNSILYRRHVLKIIAIAGLSLISMRGWMVAFFLFLFDAINIWMETKSFKTFLRESLSYVPGSIIAIAFLIWHFIGKGWIAFHDDSPWAGSFEKVGINGFIWNIGLYIWRLIDFGRIIWWLILIPMVPFILNNLKQDKKLKQLVILCILFLLLFPLNMLVHTYLMQHRYFLPTYLVIALVVLYLIHLRKISTPILPVVLAFLLAGNFIVYPDKVAQGWDSTLAHLPYYKLRSDAIDYLKQEQIPLDSVKSWFPNMASEKFISLNGQESAFSSKELEQVEYCLYSNIFNDIKDHEYDALRDSWKKIYSKKKRGVKIIIFKKSKVDFLNEKVGG